MNLKFNIIVLILIIGVIAFAVSCESQIVTPQNTLAPTIVSATITSTQTPTFDYKDTLRVHFINVGKADCTLISYNDKHYLVDTGQVSSLSQVIRTLQSNEIYKLDGIYLTHIHKDHIGGLQGLFELVQVDNVYMSEIIDYDQSGQNPVIRLCKEYNKEINYIKAGEIQKLSQDALVNYKFIGPIVQSEEINDNSLVMYLNFYDKSILLTGDMQFAEEETLLEADVLHHADILKAGNHGNKDAASKEFANLIAPDTVVIPTDKNILGEDSNVRILYLTNKAIQTFVAGDYPDGIEFSLDNNGITYTYPETDKVNKIKSVEIATIDHKAEVISIKNVSDNTIDMTNWWLFSKDGDEIYFLPDNTHIEAGDVLTIASGDAPPKSDLFWTSDNVWKKDDKAILYNSTGQIEATYDLEK